MGGGESTNERRARERVVFVLSQPGMGRWGGKTTAERLTTSPH